MSEVPKANEALLRVALGGPEQAEALLSGAAWARLCRALAAADRLVLGEGVPHDERHRAEGFRYLARFLAAGLRSCVTNDDPDYPVFARMIEYTMPWGLDHPDCLYLYAPVRGDATYRIHGSRGSANVFDVQVNSGHFSAGSVDAVNTLDSLDASRLACGAGGAVEIVLAPQPPASNGLRLAPDARFVQIRQYFADWDAERPADLWIERVGAEYPIPAPRAALVGRQLETLERWIERAGAQWETMSRGFLSMPPNSVITHHVVGEGAHGGLSGQAYALGNFECAPDEAVVIEMVAPECHHWNVSLSNWYWECIEYASRQSSLNHHQARPDSDGRTRFVIAQRDPGVANWLDPAGLGRGCLALRLYRAAARPEVSIERVPLDRLDAQLPPDTPRVDPEERSTLLERRRRAVLRRFRT